MSGFFVNAYFEAVRGTALVPKDNRHLETVLHTFLLEKSLVHLNRELTEGTQWSLVPLRIIKSVLGIKEEAGVSA